MVVGHRGNSEDQLPSLMWQLGRVIVPIEAKSTTLTLVDVLRLNPDSVKNKNGNAGGYNLSHTKIPQSRLEVA